LGLPKFSVFSLRAAAFIPKSKLRGILDMEIKGVEVKMDIGPSPIMQSFRRWREIKEKESPRPAGVPAATSARQ
jgi:hypothetical protein